MTQPTFSNNKDRLVWLLSEYKLLVFGLLMGMGFLVWYYQPAVPKPPTWVAALAVGWMVLGPICFPIGRRIALWLHYRNWPTVFHINAVEDIREKWFVPPETWENKEVDGVAPHLVNDRDDYEVREFEWMPEIGELRVRGTWLSAAKDSELVTSRTHMERIHGGLLEKARRLAEIGGQWSDRAIQMQEELINAGAEARERGQLVDKDAARDVYEDMRGDIEPADGDDFLEVTARDLAEDERPAAPVETNGHEATDD